MSCGCLRQWEGGRGSGWRGRWVWGWRRWRDAQHVEQQAARRRARWRIEMGTSVHQNMAERAFGQELRFMMTRRAVSMVLFLLLMQNGMATEPDPAWIVPYPVGMATEPDPAWLASRSDRLLQWRLREGQNSVRQKSILPEGRGTSFAQETSPLHCWRNSISNLNATFPVLVTSYGFSATAFISAAFKLVGYDIGNEQKGRHGSSCWHAVAHNDRRSISWQPLVEFQHIFLAVRHPLKVVTSKRAVLWWKFQTTDETGFIDIAQEISQNRTVWSSLGQDFRTLQWWITFTLRAEELTECYYRVEDLSPQLLLHMCERDNLPSVGRRIGTKH